MVHGHQGRGSSPLGLSEQERTKLRKRLRKLDRLIARVDRSLYVYMWPPKGADWHKVKERRNRWDETRMHTRLRLKGYGV